MLLRSPVFPPYYRMSAFHGSTHPKMTQLHGHYADLCQPCCHTLPSPAPGWTRFPGDQVGAFLGEGLAEKEVWTPCGHCRERGSYNQSWGHGQLPLSICAFKSMGLVHLTVPYKLEV